MSVQARLIDGTALAAQVQDSITRRVVDLRSAGHAVRLDTILVGDDGPAALYSRNQARRCGEVGIEHVLHRLPAEADEDAVAARIADLNHDEHARAVMLHLPLPGSMSTRRLQSMIGPAKDVEGVNPANIGNIVYGRRSLVPCTALAVIEMIESTGVTLRGAEVVCVGASDLVGKPVAVLLMQAEATVVSTNVHTVDLASHVRRAEVLISAAGVPGLITADMVRPGAVVIDVGINRVEDPATGDLKTVGDVAFDSVLDVAGWVSPVPGGVGPMTVAMLLRNTVDAAAEQV